MDFWVVLILWIIFSPSMNIVLFGKCILRIGLNQVCLISWIEEVGSNWNIEDLTVKNPYLLW